MFRQKHLLGGALGALLPLCANAFYLPGASPRNYALGEKVNLFVNALTPMLSGHDDSKLVRSLNNRE
jgi:transmembrane 9 superfamily protein 2/4